MITDAVLITVYAALAVLIVATAVSFAVHRMHQKLSSAYLWIIACLMGWLVVTFAYHITTSPWLAEYLDNLTFPFIAFLPVILLQFILRFYRGGTRVTKKVIPFLCVIPAVTTVIAVVPALNWLLRSGYTMLQMYPLHVSKYTWSVWYYIHAGYSYVLMLFCVFTVVRQYKRQPREYRLPSALMLTGIILTYLSDLPSFSMPDFIIDNTLVGVCLSMLVLYFAIVNNPAVEFLAAARTALYNNLDIPVFILDRREYVLDMNKAAHLLAAELGLPAGKSPALVFNDVVTAILDAGGQVKNGFSGDKYHHILISFHGENVVLRQVSRELIDKKGRLVGSYVAMMDITALSQKVDVLQYEADVDVLTGIPNRRAFEHHSAELDTPENLPLTFIVGDVNRLKQVNDRLGHRQGDLLLKTVAGALADACPEGGFVARTGGDEFIMVIPRCGAEEARAITAHIHARLKAEKNQFPGASIALGHITKTLAGQDTIELIHQADKLMYKQKKYDRRQQVSDA